MENQHDNFWGEPIYSYTRAQAIADGVLVNLATIIDGQGRLLCQQAGFRVPVAITRNAWANKEGRGVYITIEAGGNWRHADDGEVLELKGGQSLPGRLWDVLWMLRVASGQIRHADRVHFQVLVDVEGDGRHKLVRLWALCGPGDDARPVITIMLEGED